MSAGLVAVALLAGGIILVVLGAEAFFDGLLGTAERVLVSTFFMTVLVSGLEVENIAAGLAANLAGFPGAAAGTFLGGTTFIALAVAGIGAIDPRALSGPSLALVLVVDLPGRGAPPAFGPGPHPLPLRRGDRSSVQRGDDLNGDSMDGLRFDSVTRAFATSRRSTIRTFLGAAMGALITFRGGEEAAAGCKKVGKKCDKNKDCCDGAKCKGGKKGKCRCKSGRSDCDGDGKCESLDEDNANCGVCGNACAVGEACCDATCIDVQDDRAN